MSDKPEDRLPTSPTPEPWLGRIFPTVVRYAGLGIAGWLILTGRVAPEVALAFAGTMVSGSMATEAFIRSRRTDQ